MSLDINDFIEVVNLHPGASHFVIDQDALSGREVIKPSVVTLPHGLLEDALAERKKSDLKTMAALRKGLERRFSQAIADFSMGTGRNSDAHTIRSIIKLAESTDSKYTILSEKYIASDEFVFSFQYITHMGRGKDLLPAFWKKEYQAVVIALTEYENDVESLVSTKKKKRLGVLEAKIVALSEKQKIFLAEQQQLSFLENLNEESTAWDQEKLLNQQQWTDRLLDGVRREKQFLA